MFGRISGVRYLMATIGIALGASAVSAVDVVFNEIARFDISRAFANDVVTENPKYIGTNPLAVAWNGSKLYVAGFNNNGSFPGAGIVEVTNATATGINVVTDANLSARFGFQIPLQPTRGYTGLALKGNQLAASYDTGSDVAEAIQVFDTTTNTKVWDLATPGSGGTTASRGGSGVAFDPGFNGSAGGQGVAWTNFGQGRRRLNNPTNGLEIHGLTGSAAPGFIWAANPLPAGDTNNARDMDFDPDTGDIYVRRSNDVDKAVRTGDNTSTTQAPIVNATDAPFILGQKLEFMSNTVYDDLIIYNDRPNNNAGIAFTTSVKVIDKNGVAQNPIYNLIGGQTGADIATGAQLYDFDFDPVSQTLAVADFNNRNVFIFKVGPTTPPPSGVLGDYNNDTAVTALDYTRWAQNFGNPSNTLFNVNPAKVGTTVDASDYTIYRDQLPASVAASAAVPEPTAIAIVSLVAGWGVVVRRRK